jgi:hypothetical protein
MVGSGRIQHVMLGMLIAAVFSLGSCGPIDEAVTGNRTTVGQDGVGNDTTGVVNDPAGFYVRAFNATTHNYFDHLDTTIDSTGTTVGNFLSECKIASGTTGKDIYCLIEGKEEDIWYYGVKLHYNIPTGMCSYFMMVPYYFYMMEPHIGPAAMSYTKDGTTKAISLVTTNDPYVTIDAEGKVSCAADYSTQFDGAPNCCEGKYEITVTNVNPVNVNTIIKGDFGGKAGNCLAGPATKLDKQSSGYPFVPIYNVEGIGKNDTFQTDRPIEQRLFGDIQPQSNVLVANYMDITNDHLGVVPQAIDPTASGLVALPSTDRYYSFYCMDRGFDLVNRIRVQVRSWDTKVQYDGALAGLTNTTYPNCAACPLCAGGTFNSPAVNRCSQTLCPVDNLVAPFAGCAAGGTYDKENTPFGTFPLQDHSTWRTLQMYFSGKNSDYIGVPQPATGLYPGVKILDGIL